MKQRWTIPQGVVQRCLFLEVLVILVFLVLLVMLVRGFPPLRL